MNQTRLKQQLTFINEVEELKTVYRRNMVVGRERFENSAEHSWHIALMAIVLSEYANDDHRDVDLLKVIKMLLIHDLVEIDAGDSWLYDEAANATKAEREEESAQRIFGLLPGDQAQEFHQLWQEFEARQSSEAKMAASFDALQPMMNFLLTGDAELDDISVGEQTVREKKQHIREGSTVLWDVGQDIIAQCVDAGLYGRES
ncbi:MAG: HD domain-containing protein [Chloroflexota bacterium]